MFQSGIQRVRTCFVSCDVPLLAAYPQQPEKQPLKAYQEGPQGGRTLFRRILYIVIIGVKRDESNIHYLKLFQMSNGIEK